MDTELKIGDIVMLKSGGPRMTVVALPEKNGSYKSVVKTYYFDDKILKTFSCAAEALELMYNEQK